MSLPSGTVTFVFTDIEGSTRLLQELGDGTSRLALWGLVNLVLLAAAIVAIVLLVRLAF